jgi:hypothetical protein
MDLDGTTGKGFAVDATITFDCPTGTWRAGQQPLGTTPIVERTMEPQGGCSARR